VQNPKVSVACIAVCGALGLPGAALAQEPGVHFDPGSPAGKEYAIPLAEGRAEGAGTKNQRAAADVPFGVGITPPGGGDGPGGDGPGGRGGGGGPGDGGGDPAGSGTTRGGGPAGSGPPRSDGPQGESSGTKSSEAGRRGAGGGADRRSSKRPAVDEQAVSNAEAPVDTTGRTIAIALLVLAAGAALGLLLWWRRGQPAS
jgi:hypothetical protein